MHVKVECGRRATTCGRTQPRVLLTSRQADNNVCRQHTHMDSQPQTKRLTLLPEWRDNQTVLGSVHQALSERR